MIKIEFGYKRTDIPAMMEICARSFSGPELPTGKEFLDMLQISDVWVAIEEAHWIGEEFFPSHVVGFAIVRPQTHLGAYLWVLAVHPKYRERGVGTNLLLRALGYYKGLETMMSLHVSVHNTAQKFYTDHGFSVVHAVPKHYMTYDGLLLSRKI